MKISLITISNNELVAINKNDTIPLITSYLHKNGFEVMNNFVSNSVYENIVNNLKNTIDDADFTLCIVENELDVAFLTKKAICSLMETELTVNNFAKTNIQNYYVNANIPIPKEMFSYANMPSGARCITNLLSAFQGFLLTKNNKTIIFMPLQPEELKNMFTVSVLPFLLERATIVNKTYVFKTYGLTKHELNSILKDQIKNKNKILVVCNEKLLDAEIVVTYPENIKKEVIDSFITSICTKLSAYLYAETDTTLYERAKDLLKINNITFSVAEDISAGNFTAKFYENNQDAKEILTESYITPNNNSKIKILGVEPELFETEDIDYEEIAYEMSLGALENANTDFVVSVTGSIETGKCYIGIGNTKGIHVYKENVSGDLMQKIEKITNYTFFHLIKKIKQNDFHLLKTEL